MQFHIVMRELDEIEERSHLRVWSWFVDRRFATATTTTCHHQPRERKHHFEDWQHRTKNHHDHLVREFRYVAQHVSKRSVSTTKSMFHMRTIFTSSRLQFQRAVFSLTLLCALFSVSNMLSKLGAAFDSASQPPATRLRTNITDLFLCNEISARRTQSLLEDTQASGYAGVSDLQRLDCSKHVNRNLARRLLKKCLWPTPYWAHTQNRLIKQGRLF